MAFHYTTAAKVRQLDAMLSSQNPDDAYEFTDAVIESVIDNHAQPIIDATLGFMFTVPFTEDDDSGIIAMIAANITAAMLISGDVAQFAAADVAKANNLMEQALDWLGKVKDGEWYLSFAKIQKTVDAIYDEDPTTRPLNEVFVGSDASSWCTPNESRGST